MKIFECNFETANGDIHHQVYVDWDDTGNLKFAEIDEGEGVQECWNRDSYENFFTVDAEDMPKFFLYVLRKGFNSGEELTVATLQELCDTYKIKYTTDFWC